mgnify:CR=1 FL=1|jgi:hypothetical protein
MFGVETFDASGAMGIGTKDTAWSLVGFFAARPGIATSFINQAAAGMELSTLQLQLDFIPNNQEAYVSNVTVAGSTVSVDNTGTVNSLIMVFAR